MNAPQLGNAGLCLVGNSPIHSIKKKKKEMFDSVQLALTRESALTPTPEGQSGTSSAHLPWIPSLSGSQPGRPLGESYLESTPCPWRQAASAFVSRHQQLS